MIIAATGHRPDKLGGYDPKIADQLMVLAAVTLRKLQSTEVISGMALGWDQAVAKAAVSCKIPFIAAVPFAGQELKWPQESQTTYRYLMQCAARVEIVCEGGYAPWKMQVRNQWMVDNADKMLALWDGSSGGTANCLKYAEKKQKPIENVWPDWVKFSA